MTPLALAVVVLTANPSEPARPQIRSVHKTWKSNGGQCTFDITWPVVEGLSDAKIAAEVKRQIELLFPSQKRFAEECSPSSENDKSKIEAGFSVGLEDSGYLSFQYSGLEYALDAEGNPAGAHPTKIYQGLTLSLADGKPITWRALFQKGALPKVEAKLARQYEGIETKPDRDFYLTRYGVVVMNLFDNFAAGSLTATLRHQDLAPLAAPGSPIAALAALPAPPDLTGRWRTPSGETVTILGGDESLVVSFEGPKKVCSLWAIPSAADLWRSESAPDDRLEVSDRAIVVHSRCRGAQPSVELSRAEVRPPATCSVIRQRAPFYDPEAGEPRSAYVVKGDAVDVAPSEERGKKLARYKGAKSRTLGLLESAALDCK